MNVNEKLKPTLMTDRKRWATTYGDPDRVSTLCVEI